MESAKNPQTAVDILKYYLHIVLAVVDKLLLLMVIFFAIYACCISCPGVKERRRQAMIERRKESLRMTSLRRGSERRGTEMFE